MKSFREKYENSAHIAIAVFISLIVNSFLFSLIDLSEDPKLIEKLSQQKQAKKLMFKSWVKTIAKNKKDKKKLQLKEKKKEKLKNKLQIVENTPSLKKETAPEDTKLASLYERKVKKQSLAKDRELSKKKHAQKKNEKKVKPIKIQRQKQAKKKAASEKKPIKQNRIKSKLAGKGLKLDFKLREGLEIFEKQENPSIEGLKPDRSKLLSMIDKPVLERIESDGVPFADYVENIEDGEETLLNTKEYKFAGYFSRIKRKVGPEWYKRLKYETRRRDPTRKIYLNKQRITVLNIFLDTQGHFLKADILESSGVRFIDKIAVRSFIATSPFLNPPTALRNQSGEISLKFAFIIQVDAPPIYEIFK